MSDDKELKQGALEILASAAQTAASLSPGLGRPGLTPVLQGLAAILRASEVAMRVHGKTVDEIVRDISLPRQLDTTFRGDVDTEVQKKKPRPR